MSGTEHDIPNRGVSLLIQLINEAPGLLGHAERTATIQTSVSVVDTLPAGGTSGEIVLLDTGSDVIAYTWSPSGNEWIALGTWDRDSATTTLSPRVAGDDVDLGAGDLGAAIVNATTKFQANGSDGASATVTVLTALRDNAGTTEYKSRDLTFTTGIVTTIGAESGWTAI